MNLRTAMEQLRRMWTGISVTQRISLGVAAIAVVSGLVFFTNWRKESGFRPLFSGLSSEDAGAVLAKLKESGIEHRVSENGSVVMVPSAIVAETRLQMAAAGIPKTGRVGYELFDKTNLGTSDFAEQVNYRRALEGELERSIRVLSEVEQARVHLTLGKDSVFTEARLPAKASVLITLKPAAQLPPDGVRAIVHLVSSAVEGLNPENVSITDSAGHLLNRPKSPQSLEEASDESIEYRQKLERNLSAKVTSTLEPLLGAGKFRVGMSVDCDFSSGEQSEELYDPEKSVMLTTQKSEETSGSTATGGVPGTASNLPRPAPRASGSGNSVMRRTENITYQTSRTVRRTRLPQGTVRRISISVLLDEPVRWELQGGKQVRTFATPTPERIQAIKELVSATIGLNTTRGDQLVVQSLPFEDTMQAPPPPVPTTGKQQSPENQKNPVGGLPFDWRIAAGAGAALLLIAGGGFMFWKKRNKKRPAPKRSAAVQGAAELPGTDRTAGALPAGTQADLPETASGTSRLLAQAQERFVQTAKVETLAEELRNSIAQDPELAASVLRTWLEAEEAK